MARYEHLPIYRKSFDLAVCIENAVSSFPRKHRYVLGARLQGLSQDVLCLVIRAQNESGDRRVVALDELRISVELLKNLLHLGKEVRAFSSFGAFANTSDLAVEVGRQAEGWRRSSVGSSHKPESRRSSPRGGPP